MHIEYRDFSVTILVDEAVTKSGREEQGETPLL